MSFLSRFFGKKPVKSFLSFSPQDSSWRVVSWNFDLKDPTHRQWSIEIKKPQQSQQIDWTRSKKTELKFISGKESTIFRPSEGDGSRELMNLAIHSTLKHSLESNHDFLLTPVSGVTALDFQNETRALQWIQASFGTLTRALDQLESRSDLILTAALFSGHEASSGQDVLRLMVFNLDVFFYFRSDFSLQVAVFDDKDQGHGSSKSPSFQQIIKVTKPQIYDEIVKLLHRIATVGEIR